MSERLISRRTFLKSAAASTFVLSAPEIATRLSNAYLRSERSARPKSLEEIQESSIVIGFAPHGNNAELAIDYRDKIGQMPHIINFFSGGSTPFTSYPSLFENINKSILYGCVPMVSHGMPLKNHDLEALTRDLLLIDSPFLLRLWYEMNGDWTNEWYGKVTDQEFIDIWQKTYEHFAKNVPNANLVFSPNETVGARPFSGIYPGDSYVKAVSLDGYNKFRYDPFDPKHYVSPNLAPEEIFGPDIKTFQEIAPNMPLFISEVNTTLENADVWLVDAYRFFARSGAKGILTFDWNKAGVSIYEYDWDVTRYPRVVANLSQELQQNYYVRESDISPNRIQGIMRKLLT